MLNSFVAGIICFYCSSCIVVIYVAHNDTFTVQAQLSPLLGGLDGSVAYISCGEGQFPIRRLSQLAKYYQEKYSIKNQDLLSGIHIEECPNLDDFMAILVPSCDLRLSSTIIESKNIRHRTKRCRRCVELKGSSS